MDISFYDKAYSDYVQSLLELALQEGVDAGKYLASLELLSIIVWVIAILFIILCAYEIFQLKKIVDKQKEQKESEENTDA